MRHRLVYPPTGSMALKGRWAPHLRPTLPLMWCPYSIRPDCSMNLKVLCKTVRHSDLERSLLADRASSKGTVITSFSACSLSFQTSVTAEVSFWWALSYWLHWRKKCSRSSTLWPQSHECTVLVGNLYGLRCKTDSCSNILIKLTAVFL